MYLCVHSVYSTQYTEYTCIQHVYCVYYHFIIHIHDNTYMIIHIYIYMYLYICMALSSVQKRTWVWGSGTTVYHHPHVPHVPLGQYCHVVRVRNFAH